MKRLGAAETSCFIRLLCCSLPQAARLKLETSSLNRDVFRKWQNIRNIMDKSRLELFLAEYETKETLSVQFEAIWKTLKDLHCPSDCSYSQRDIQAQLGCKCGDSQMRRIADEEEVSQVPTADGHRVRVDVFYEVFSPESRSFIQYQLMPA